MIDTLPSQRFLPNFAGDTKSIGKESSRHRVLGSVYQMPLKNINLGGKGNVTE